MPFDVISSERDPVGQWRVLAWYIAAPDPYRPARSVASAVCADYAGACALADLWARVVGRSGLSSVVFVEVMRCE